MAAASDEECVCLLGYCHFSLMKDGIRKVAWTYSELNNPADGECDKSSKSRLFLQSYVKSLKDLTGNVEVMSIALSATEDDDEDVDLEFAIRATFIKEIGSMFAPSFMQVEGMLSDMYPRHKIRLQFKTRFPMEELLDLDAAATRKMDWIRKYVSSATEEDNLLQNHTLVTRFCVSLWWPKIDDGVKISSNPGLQSFFGVESSKDLTIVVGNGTEVKGHRNVFSAYSPVFEAMLSPGSLSLESQTGKIEMKENSEDGMKLLVRYLYGFQIENEEFTADLAVELFKTAHKYSLTQLEDHLGRLLSQQSIEWWATPDDILELYLYVKNIDGFDKLCDRLKMMIEKLATSAFQKLKKEEPEKLFKMLELGGKNEEGAEDGRD